MLDYPLVTRRRALQAGCALAVSAASSGCLISAEPYRETTERSFEPGDADALSVFTGNGDLTLAATDDDVVTGTVTIESRSGKDALDDVSVSAGVTEGTLRIEPAIPDDVDKVTVHLDLSVPTDLPVERAAAENGEVTVSDVTGDVTCKTTNGDVLVRGVDGFVTVGTTNGDVTARDQTGFASASTTNGDVDIDVPALRSDASCKTTNGEVTAAVPADISAAVELVTVHGDADVADGVAIETTTRRESTVNGTIGEDEPEYTLRLRSTNGDVRLESL